MDNTAEMFARPVPQHVTTALARYRAPAQARLLEVRELIFEVAAQTDGVGALTETLKWGEPAYLTEASGSGTTIRLGVSRQAPDACAVFFNCQTTLIEQFRAQFGRDLAFEGNRGLIIACNGPLPRAAIAFCLHAALVYHRRSKP